MHFDGVRSFAGDEAAHVATPCLLNENCLSLDMLIAPFVAEHAPIRLDADRSEALLLSLLLCLTAFNNIAC